MDTKPRIAVTMGDPAGVGPELCLRLLNDRRTSQSCTVVIFGNSVIMNKVARKCGLKPPEQIIDGNCPDQKVAEIQTSCLLDLATEGIDAIRPGQHSVQAGRAGSLFLNSAIQAALAGHVHAITTAPLNKKSLNLAGVTHPGHTEILAEATGSKNFCMMQYSEELTATFATCHVGLEEVAALITRERVLEVIRLTARALEILPSRPSKKIIVLGLNPHSGEDGLFGNMEEENAIIPAIESAREMGIDIEGPIPPDTAFLPQRRAETGCFVCMYHDQGHIPLKALAFDQAVNTTLGLPIVRTSVDHGTAFDIAWQGTADPGSLQNAVKLAGELAMNKTPLSPV
ncbi:MAG: 4-hydroxythreonine-4-phosphate dehydrogenase PdxA [Verrucomicrobiota bacterium]|nr:4-hydroxythreonine-4-phosphate dehydrogenase PdxA [Verrucomicrobiota bacterium]